MAVPVVMPETVPADALTDTLMFRLLQVPPDSTSLRVTEAPVQIFVLPFIGCPFTVTVVEIKQPALSE